MSKIKPLVSVIIPIYNSEKYISQTVRSVLSQTYQNFEIILIDDASEDNSFNIAGVLTGKDSRIKLFKIDRAGRPSVPRNVGIKKASGELIAFLDSDDLWDKNKLQMQVRFLENNPLIFLVYNMCVTFGDVNFFSPYFEVLPLWGRESKSFTDLVTRGNTLQPSSVMVKREFLLKLNGFDEDPELRIEDYDLWIRLSKLGNFGFIPRILTYYRVHSSQFSSDWETKAKRLEYLEAKSGMKLPHYRFYRNKGRIILFFRNLVHVCVYLSAKVLSLVDKLLRRE